MISSEIVPLALFDIGGQELIVIFLAVLLFLGPKKLPELARALAKARSEFNKASRDFTQEIERAAHLPESSEPKKIEAATHTIPHGEKSHTQQKTDSVDVTAIASKDDPKKVN